MEAERTQLRATLDDVCREAAAAYADALRRADDGMREPFSPIARDGYLRIATSIASMLLVAQSLDRACGAAAPASDHDAHAVVAALLVIASAASLEEAHKLGAPAAGWADALS